MVTNLTYAVYIVYTLHRWSNNKSCSCSYKIIVQFSCKDQQLQNTCWYGLCKCIENAFEVARISSYGRQRGLGKMAEAAVGYSLVPRLTPFLF